VDFKEPLPLETLLKEGSKVEIGMGSTHFIEKIDNLMALAISKQMEGEREEERGEGGRESSHGLPKFTALKKQRLEEAIRYFVRI
jgi:hypothetical protein